MYVLCPACEVSTRFWLLPCLTVNSKTSLPPPPATGVLFPALLPGVARGEVKPSASRHNVVLVTQSVGIGLVMGLWQVSLTVSGPVQGF